MATIDRVPILDLRPEVQQLWEPLNAAFQNVLRSTQFIMGTEVVAFENEVAAYLGVKHAIGLNSGTDALVIALRALGIGPGDEVITTPFSFFATAESISTLGAKPVFVDVDPSSFNIDPEQIAQQITPRTKAIMPVHLFGNPAQMGRIMQIADAHGLKVVEDCAQSFGARYAACENCNCQGRGQSYSRAYTGTIGHMGAFSFFPSKNLGAYGDAGLIVTNDDSLADIARMLRSHGSRKRYHNEVLGYNSRLDSLQAAILRVKLPHIAAWNLARRNAATTYNQLLRDTTGVICPTLSEGHVFHQYTLRLNQPNRDQVQKKMQALGIETMVYYPIPQDLLPVYKGQYPPNPSSTQLAQQVLSLPIWPQITQETQERVVSALHQALT